MNDFQDAPYARAVETIVAVVYDDEGNEYDRCYGWEAGQNYALHEGLRVVATADDGLMTKNKAQAMYDAERARFRDCWDITSEPAPILAGEGPDNDDWINRAYQNGAVGNERTTP